MTEDTNQPLTPAQRQEILDALSSVHRVERLSFSYLARVAMQCSESTYQMLRSGFYKGSGDGFLRRAARWLSQRGALNAEPGHGYVATLIGRRIQRICHRAWTTPCMATIIAPSGVGKTAALRNYAVRHAARTLMIQAGVALNTKGGILEEMAVALGLAAGGAYRAAQCVVYRTIREHLAERYAGGRGEPTLLIVDEATTLRPDALNLLRNLHDEPSCRLAVVLADTWRMDRELHRAEGIPGGYEQLRSRLGAAYAMAADEPIQAEDVKGVCQSVLKDLGFEGSLRADAMKYLQRLAAEPGRLRNVVYRLQAVHDVAEAAGREATYCVGELDEVADLVGGKREIHTAERSAPLRAAV